MSREWYHYPDGVETAWPEGDLPSPDSVFRADFLNQFISWGKYLNSLSPLSSARIYYGPVVGYVTYPGVHTMSRVVKNQTPVQAASFLNSFHAFPGPGWLVGWQQGETLQPAFEMVSTPSAPYRITPGTDIHPRTGSSSRIRLHFLACRQRLDALIACKTNLGGSTSTVRCWWRQLNGGGTGGGCNAPVVKSKKRLLLRYHGPWTNPTGNECESESIVDYIVPAPSSPCGAAVYAVNIRGDSPWPQCADKTFPCPEPASTAEVVGTTAEITGGSWTAISGAYGGISSPSWPAGENWGYPRDTNPVREYISVTELRTALLPLDSLPAQYRL